MKLKKLASIALAAVLTLGLLPALGGTALAADTTSYTLTIPSTLSVANSGWNATSGISATGTLESGKKLTVTASSANSWALKQQDGSETVSYTMKETSDGAAKTSWEFTSFPGSATLGIDVSDYSSKPAGTYTDTVTFTASVVDSIVKVTGITLNKENTHIAVGNYEILSVTKVLPENATDKTYTWASANSTIATVDNNGKVTGVAAGIVDITATANDGSGIKVACLVEVFRQQYTIHIDPGNGLDNIETFELTYYEGDTWNDIAETNDKISIDNNYVLFDNQYYICTEPDGGDMVSSNDVINPDNYYYICKSNE